MMTVSGALRFAEAVADESSRKTAAASFKRARISTPTPFLSPSGAAVARTTSGAPRSPHHRSTGRRDDAPASADVDVFFSTDSDVPSAPRSATAAPALRSSTMVDDG